MCIKPDIAHAMGVLSIYMYNFGKDHWIYRKRVLDICMVHMIFLSVTKK